MAQRWRRRPPGSNWGDFGPDDQIGRLNLLTPGRVRRAVEEVREGRTFCLSLPLDLPGGTALAPKRRPPRMLVPARHADRANFLYPLMLDGLDATDVISDDAVLLHTQYSTQWDGLAHIGALFDADGDGETEIVFYNGWRGDTDMSAAGCAHHGRFDGLYAGGRADALGIEHMARQGCQGRGIMLDLRHHLAGRGGAVGWQEIEAVLKADGIVVEPGDMLCIHTGFADLLVEMKGEPDLDRLSRECVALDGSDRQLLDWITKSGISVIAADNFAVEIVPAVAHVSGGTALPLHEHCIFKLGIHLGELWLLGELAAWLRGRGRHRFLLTAPPLRLPGAVGSPATPIATV